MKEKKFFQLLRDQVEESDSQNALASEEKAVRPPTSALDAPPLEGADRRIRSEERGKLLDDVELEGADRRIRSEERGKLLDDVELESADRRIRSEEGNMPVANAAIDCVHAENAPKKNTVDSTDKSEETDVTKNFAYHIAEKLLEFHQIFADITDDSLLIYDESMGYFKRWKKRNFGIWLRGALCKSDAKAQLGRHMVEDIFYRLSTTPDIQATLNDFAPEQPYLNALNGVIDIQTGQLLPHSPEYRFLNVIHANYLGEGAPEARKFNELMQAWFGEDLLARKQFLQALAYLFSEYYTAKICVYCVGDSNTGKSTLLNFIDMMVGEDVVSHVPLEDLSKEHVLPQLYGMKINSYAERDEGGKPLSKTGAFKAISGGDWVLANPKHLPHFKFKSRTKCIFMSNRRLQINPRISEDALFNRFLFINICRKADERKLIAEFEKMLFYEEADAILTMLVPILRKWIYNGRKFVQSEGSMHLMEDLKAQRSSVEEYGEARCMFEAGAKTTVKALKEDYEKFCSDNALEALAPATFIRDFVERYHLTKRKPHDLWYVIGIRLQPLEGLL